MKENYRELKRFPFEEIIIQIAELFDASEIRYHVENTRPSFDITFTNSTAVDYIIKVHPDDFIRAEKLLEQVGEEAYVIEEHYMNSFSDEDILDVIEHASEWDAFDVQIAYKIIENRGLKIGVINQSISNHLTTYQPEDVKPIALVMAYILALAGGWLGGALAYGWLVKKSEKPGFENEKYYSVKSRNHANIIFGIFCIWVFVYLVLILDN